MFSTLGDTIDFCKNTTQLRQVGNERVGVNHLLGLFPSIALTPYPHHWNITEEEKRNKLTEKKRHRRLTTSTYHLDLDSNLTSCRCKSKCLFLEFLPVIIKGFTKYSFFRATGHCIFREIIWLSRWLKALIFLDSGLTMQDTHISSKNIISTLAHYLNSWQTPLIWHWVGEKKNFMLCKLYKGKQKSFHVLSLLMHFLTDGKLHKVLLPWRGSPLEILTLK